MTKKRILFYFGKFIFNSPKVLKKLNKFSAENEALESNEFYSKFDNEEHWFKYQVLYHQMFTQKEILQSLDSLKTIVIVVWVVIPIVVGIIIGVLSF